MKLIRCIKAFCADFQPIRQILTSLGATYVEQTEQVDYFFLLPSQVEPSPACRLKLRIENDQPRWIYCYDRNQDGSSMVTFRRCEVRDPNIKDVLAAALGIDVVVRKHREVWCAERAVFNLDQSIRRRPDIRGGTRTGCAEPAYTKGEILRGAF